MKGTHTYQEIMTQADAWDSALKAFGKLDEKIFNTWQQAQPNHIVVTGCGSTYYLAQTAARLMQTATAVPATAVPASDLVFFVDDIVPDPPNTLLIAISRSGTTTETIEAVHRFKKRHGKQVWVVTCDPKSPLTKGAALVLPAEAAQEESVAQTRSFTSMLVLVQTLGAHLERSLWQDMTLLPDHGRRLLAENEALMKEIAARQDLKRVVFLGSGTRYGVASEAMLKMMEMSLTPSQAFHFMEFRHGPMAVVGPDMLLVGLLTGTTLDHEVKVLNEMMGLGAATLVLNPTGYEVPGTWKIQLPEEIRVDGQPVLYLPPLQLLAYHRALVNDLDPDKPRNLTAVVELDAASLSEH